MPTAEHVPDLPAAPEPVEPPPTPTTPVMANSVVSEAEVGLPVESGGSVYDPSKAQATVTAASDRLRSVALTSDDSPARVDPLSLGEHAPLPPPSLDSAGRLGAKVEVLVEASGIATEVNVVESSGDAALDAAIIDAARTWSYEPARTQGSAVTSRLQLDVTLERGTDSDGSATLD